MRHNEDQPNTQSYHELVTACQGKLFAFISSLIAGGENASDVLQETNVVLWEKASLFEPGSNFSAWSYQIAHFQVLAYRKRQQRDRRLMFDDDLVSLLAADFQKCAGDFDDSLTALQRCLGQLEARQRDLIRERYEQGRTPSGLAEIFGRKASSISASLYRTRKALLKCIERTLVREGAL